MKKCIHTFCLFLTFLLPHPFALSQVVEAVEAFPHSPTGNIVESTQKFYFFPGGRYYGKHAPNIFTITFCTYMEALLGDDFVLVDEPISHQAFKNVGWALWNGQKPLPNPDKNRKASKAFEKIVGDPNGIPDEITIISSSFGTVLAAQAGKSLANYCRENGLDKKIDLFFGASMLSKNSDLFYELEALQKEGLIRHIVYDELQDPGDNVTGMCGNSKLGAYLKAFEMAWVFGGNYQGQPSILNNHPYNGHIHHQRAQSIDKGKEFVSVILIDYEMAGLKVKERVYEIFSQSE